MRPLRASSVLLPLASLLSLATPLPAQKKPAASRVTIRDGRRLLVNGKPFFPIGLYYSEEEQADTTGKQLEELRKLGFNTLFFSGGLEAKPTLDRIAAAGFKVQYRPPGAMSSGLDNLKALVTALKDQPAVLFWEVEDEPLINNVSLESTRPGVALVKQIDPNHPVLCVQYPDWKKPDLLKQWGELVDVYSFDYYPVPLKRWYYQGKDLPAGVPHTVAVMGHMVSWFQSLAPNKPILPVLQAWAWHPFTDGRDGYATAQQSRYMAYQVVIRGACGILYYGKRKVGAPHTPSGIPDRISENPEELKKEFERSKELNTWFWSYFEPVVRELADMSPVFTAPDAKQAPTVRILPGSEAHAGEVESRCKQVNGKPVLLVVNSSEHPCQIEVTGRDFAKRKVHCWRENRTLVGDAASAFRDKLEPFAVRIYSTQPATVTR